MTLGIGPWLAVFGCLVFELSKNEIQSFQNSMIIQSHSNNEFLKIIHSFHVLLCRNKKLVGPISL